jgi:hypothetical protein
MDYASVIAAGVTGAFGIISTVLSHLLTKSSFQRKAESEKRRRSALGATLFGEESLKKLTEIESVLYGIEAIKDNIFEEAALKKIEQCLADISQIKEGRIRIEQPVELTNIPSELSRRMKSLKATSLWKDDPARGARRQRFLELQATCIKARKATVQRLFIIDETTLIQHKSDFLARMQSDQNDGVEVRWILKSDWMKSENAIEPVDFGIWDDDLLWVYQQSAKEENRLWIAYLIRSNTDKRKYSEIFQANWQTAFPPEDIKR